MLCGVGTVAPRQTSANCLGCPENKEPNEGEKSTDVKLLSQKSFE